MAKLDRLGWADGMSFTAYGVRFGLRVNDAAIMANLIARLPPGSKPSPVRSVHHLYSLTGFANGSNGRVRRFNLAYANTLRIARTVDLEGALAAFESDMRLYIAERARRRVFVHAGVVAWRGRAIVIPGRSFSGKSRLVAALVRAGATYYSDEYAVFDDRGRVHPFPSPLSLRGEDGTPPTRHAPESLGAAVGTAPLPVGLVAVSTCPRAL